jgi:hypothetical protein
MFVVSFVFENPELDVVQNHGCIHAIFSRILCIKMMFHLTLCTSQCSPVFCRVPDQPVKAGFAEPSTVADAYFLQTSGNESRPESIKLPAGNPQSLRRLIQLQQPFRHLPSLDAQMLIHDRFAEALPAQNQLFNAHIQSQISRAHSLIMNPIAQESSEWSA